MPGWGARREMRAGVITQKQLHTIQRTFTTPAASLAPAQIRFPAGKSSLFGPDPPDPMMSNIGHDPGQY